MFNNGPSRTGPVVLDPVPRRNQRLLFWTHNDLKRFKSLKSKPQLQNLKFRSKFKRSLIILQTNPKRSKRAFRTYLRPMLIIEVRTWWATYYVVHNVAATFIIEWSGRKSWTHLSCSNLGFGRRHLGVCRRKICLKGKRKISQKEKQIFKLDNFNWIQILKGSKAFQLICWEKEADRSRIIRWRLLLVQKIIWTKKSKPIRGKSKSFEKTLLFKRKKILTHSGPDRNWRAIPLVWTDEWPVFFWG